MRLISQDGEVDVSYENVLLAISDGGLAVVIKAYNYISYNDFMCMGLYETVEKAKAVMKMVRDLYLSRMELDGGYDNVNGCYVQPNYWVLPKVFQFPQDDEIEV